MNVTSDYQGVIFNWYNVKEIKNKYKGKGRNSSLQSYINKISVDYIATRPGTVLSENNHGLFGNIYIDDHLASVEELELSEILNTVSSVTKDNKDVFKTVISLKEEDAIKKGFTSRQNWEDLLKLKVEEVRKNIEPPINIEDFEWIASFHAEKGHPHCHLTFWNKSQKELGKQPFMNYKNIRKEFSKEIFKNELSNLYDIKNVSKKEIANMTKEELHKFQEDLKAKFRNPDLKLLEVDIEKDKKWLEEQTADLKDKESLFIYNKDNPEDFTKITCEVKKFTSKYYGHEKIIEERKLLFQNNGEFSLLYKDENDITDTALFLKNFENLRYLLFKR